MAIIGIQTNTTNPPFLMSDFTFWMPQFKKFMQTPEGATYWSKLYPIANHRIFKSIYGTDWELAMSLLIAHYMTLIALQEQAPSGESLSEIAGGGAMKGVISSASVGGFSVSYETNKTISEEEEAKWFNLTSYGAQLWALMKTKHVASIFVVTSNPVPGGN